jgi:hypothetical protein
MDRCATGVGVCACVCLCSCVCVRVCVVVCACICLIRLINRVGCNSKQVLDVNYKCMC